MKKISKSLILVVLLIFIGTISVNATYSAGSEQTVDSGKDISITVTSTEKVDSYNIDLSSYGELKYTGCSKAKDSDDDMISVNSDKGSIGYMTTSEGTKTLGTYKFKAPEVNEDKTFKVTFDINKGDATVIATIKVEAPEKEPEKPVTPTTPTQPAESNKPTEPDIPTTIAPEPVKSSDATLKMLGIGSSANNPSKYDFSGFKNSKLDYSITVPYDVQGLEVYYSVNNSKAKCTVSGNTGFEVGTNTIKVNVTAEDGTQKTYTIKVTREEEKSGDATLSNLGIGKSASEASEYDFSGFQKSTYEYRITVPYEVTSLDVYYSLSKSTSIADVSGSSDFKVGENVIKVLVTAEDGTQKTYTINVTRLEKETAVTEPEGNETNQPNGVIENGLKLETLELSNGKLSPNFDGNVTEYSVTVGSNVNSIEITAIANEENATIEIAGNEALVEGENIITILVRSEDDSNILTYQIKITKKNEIDILGFITDKENRNVMIILGIILILIIVIIILLVRESKNDEYEEVKEKTKKGKAKRFKEDNEETIENAEEKENINNN